jgi:hypothetical protein
MLGQFLGLVSGLGLGLRWGRVRDSMQVKKVLRVVERRDILLWLRIFPENLLST